MNLFSSERSIWDAWNTELLKRVEFTFEQFSEKWESVMWYTFCSSNAPNSSHHTFFEAATRQIASDVAEKNTGSHKVQSLRKLLTGSNKWASRINYFKFSIWLPGNRRRWHDTIRSTILDAHCAAIKCVSITLFNPFSHISYDIS